MSDVPLDQDWNYSAETVLRSNILSIAFESFTFATLLAISSAAIWHIYRNRTSSQSLLSRVSLAIIPLLTLASTVHWGLSLAWALRSSTWEITRAASYGTEPLKQPNGDLAASYWASLGTTRMALDRMFVQLLNFLVAELVCVWLLWRCASRGLRIAIGIVSGLALLSFLAIAIFSITQISLPNLDLVDSTGWADEWAAMGQIMMGATFWILVADRVWVVVCWICMVWKYHMKLGHSFMDGSRGQTWFVAMVESGILYFAFWVTYAVMFIAWATDGTVPEYHVSVWSFFSFYNEFLVGCIVHITTIHVTLLLLCAVHGITFGERIARIKAGSVDGGLPLYTGKRMEDSQ